MAVDYSKLKANGFMLQKQKDRFSARLRVVGGNLTCAQLTTIAKVAKRFGAGRVHLTSRQSVEIPFVKLEEIEDFIAALKEGGVEMGASGPRVRTITACQGGACCPSGNIDAYELAKDLDARYYGRTLPHKFKIGVTGCPNNCLKAEENDVGIKGGAVVTPDADKCVRCGACAKVCRPGAITITDEGARVDRKLCRRCGKCAKKCPKGAIDAKFGYIVSFGGTFGNEIVSAKTITPLVEDKETLFRVVDAALDFFERNAQKGERLAKTIKRTGRVQFNRIVRAAYKNK